MSNIISNPSFQQYIPEEMYLEIMQWVPEETLLNARLVNSLWCRICSDNKLWASILSAKALIPFPRNPKHSLLQHHMLNNPGLKIHHIQSHLGKCFAAWGKTIGVWKKIALYPQDQFECTYTETDHSGSINTFFFHKKSCVPYMVTGSADATLKVWKMTLGTHQFELLETLDAHEAPILKVTGTTHTLFSGSADGKLCVWNDNSFTSKPSYTLHQSLETGQRPITALETDGKVSYLQLFSGGNDGSIKVWKKKNGKLESYQVLEGHEKEITSLKYDSSSRLLFSASADRCIRIWNCVNGKFFCESLISDAHSDKVTDILPFQKGKILVSTSVDGSIKLWMSDDNGSWNLKTTVSIANGQWLSTLSAGSLYQSFPQVYSVAAGIISQLDFSKTMEESIVKRSFFPVTLTPSTTKEVIQAANEELNT